MTETSYTAWDDKLYQWPPPEGWYEASDGKWWPQGYGPAAEAGESAEAAEGAEAAGGGESAEQDVDADDRSGVSDWPAAAGAGAAGAAATGMSEAGAIDATEAVDVFGADRAGSTDLGGLAGAATDAAGGLGGDIAQGADAIGNLTGDASDAADRAAGGLGDLAGDVADRAPGGLGDLGGVAGDAADRAAGGLGDLAGDVADRAPGGLGDLGGVAGDAADEATGGLGGLAGGVADRAGGLADDVSGRAGDFAGDAADRAGDLVGGTNDRAGALGGLADAATDRAGDLAGDAAARADGLADALPGDVADRVGGLGGLTDGATDRAGDLAGGIAGGAADRAGGLVDDATDRAGAVGGLAGGGLGGLDDAAGAVGERVADTAADTAATAAEAGDAAGGAGSGLLASARDALGGLGRGRARTAEPSLDDVLPDDDVGAALAETLAVRPDAETAGDLVDGGAGGPATGLNDLPVAAVVDAATDVPAPDLDGPVDGVRDGFDHHLDAGSTELDRAAAGFGTIGGPASADDADATRFVGDDGLDTDSGSPGGRSRVDLDALPPPLFDPPPSTSASASASADVSVDPSDGAGLVDGATTLDRAAAAFPSIGSATDVNADVGTDIDPDGPPPRGGTLFPPPTSERPDHAAPPGFEDPATLGHRADETMAIPDALADAATDPANYGGPGGLAAETGQVAGHYGAASPADAAGVGPLGAPPGNDTWAAPGPDPAGAGATTGNWDQSGYGTPAGGDLGLDRPDLGRPSGQGVSSTFIRVALGVLVLVGLGIVAFMLINNDGDGEPPVEETGLGSLAEPHDRSTGVEVFYPTGDGEQRWVVEVLEPVRDATAEAAGGGPAAGQALAATSVRVRNQNAQATASLTELRFNVVTTDGTVISRDDGPCPELAGGLNGATTLEAAGVSEGVLCWAVPAEALPGLLLAIESTEVDGRIHISLE